jgi:hypothetical protein
MKFEAFIPDWPGPKQHAKEIADIIAPHCKVTVLDDPQDYFNAQWKKAREQFTGDVLLWIMADVTLPEDFGGMFCKMQKVFDRGDIGWWAPDVAWTSYIYRQIDLKPVEYGIFEVPNTDSLCIAIRGDVVRAMPHIDPQVSFMWGMDFVAIATARLMGLKVVRDYRFKVLHPNSTGYDIPRASCEMAAVFATLPAEHRAEIERLLAEDNHLKKRAKNVSQQ